jgi:hypothetical protein
MSGRFIFIIVTLFTLTSPSPAWSAPLSDGDVLDQILAGMIRTSLSGVAPNAGSAIRLDFSCCPALQPRVRNTVEAAVSAAGLAITERESEYRLSILIYDIRCTLAGRNGSYDRFISMTAYITCADRSGATVLARRFDEQHRDNIAGSFLEKTNTAGKFSGDVRRNIIDNRRVTLKTVSFVILAASLAYFSIRL